MANNPYLKQIPWNPPEVAFGRRAVEVEGSYHFKTSNIVKNVINSKVYLDLTDWNMYTSVIIGSLSLSRTTVTLPQKPYLNDIIPFAYGMPIKNTFVKTYYFGQQTRGFSSTAESGVPHTYIINDIGRKVVVVADLPFKEGENTVFRQYVNWQDFVDEQKLEPWKSPAWNSQNEIPQLLGINDHNSYWLRLQSKFETPTHWVVNYLYWGRTDDYANLEATENVNDTETPTLQFYTIIIRKRLHVKRAIDSSKWDTKDYFFAHFWNTWHYDLKHGSDLNEIKVGNSPYTLTGQNEQTGLIKEREIIALQDPNYLKALPTPRRNINFQTVKYVKKFFQHTFVWGIKNHPNLLYYSDYDNHCYFPEFNVIEVSKNSNETIQDIVFFQNSVLIVITDKSVYMVKQALGTNKEFIGFQTIQINAGIGTPFRRSVQTIGAHVYFVGTDLRVYAIKSLYNTTTEEKFNLQVVDDKITNFLKPKLKAKLTHNPDRLFAESHNMEYQLFFDQYRFRYYTDPTLKCWTYDESSLFNNILGALSRGGELYLFTRDKIYLQDDEIQMDANQKIEFVLTTPQYDFGSPHHKKSFKKAFLQFGDMKATVPINFGLSVKVDDMIVRASRSDLASNENNEYRLDNYHQANVRVSEFSGRAGDSWNSSDLWYPANDWDFDGGETDKQINQRKIYASGRGLNYQLRLVYAGETKLKLRSLGVELRVRSAK